MGFVLWRCLCTGWSGADAVDENSLMSEASTGLVDHTKSITNAVTRCFNQTDSLHTYAERRRIGTNGVD